MEFKESFKELLERNYILETLKEDVNDLINENKQLQQENEQLKHELAVWKLATEKELQGGENEK